MYRIDDTAASTTLPTPEAANVEGYWTEGAPASGVPATLIRASWLNMIQEELRAIPVAAGIVPSKTTYNQILSALKAMFAPVVGTVRNLVMSVPAAAATATLTADEIIVETALGGQTYKLPTFNKTINLSTAGVGGMDTGSAPVSGFIALYAIYNPTTATSALLASNATAAIAPNVYGGANMPSGYTASALISVWQTNSSAQLIPGYQKDRRISVGQLTVLSTGTGQSSFTALSISGVVPKNARTIWGSTNVINQSASTSSSLAVNVAASVSLIGIQYNQSTIPPGQMVQNYGFDLITSQTLYYQTVSTPSVTASYNIYITAYEF